MEIALFEIDTTIARERRAVGRHGSISKERAARWQARSDNRAANGWHRPCWPFGTQVAAGQCEGGNALTTDFDIPYARRQIWRHNDRLTCGKRRGSIKKALIRQQIGADAHFWGPSRLCQVQFPT